MQIKRALVITFAERYFSIAIQFLITAVVARVLTPAEFGLVAIGTSVFFVVDSLRDFGISNYLVQCKHMSRETAQMGFTIIAIASSIVCIGLLLGAGQIAAFYNEARLAPYFKVMALTELSGIVVSPLLVLMRRDMDFASIAINNITYTLVTSIGTIILVFLGFSYMSFAWAGLAAMVSIGLLGVYMRRDFWIYRPCLKGWRAALGFGSYSGLSDVLSRIQEMLSYIVLGHMLSTSAIGLFNRANFIATVPPKLLMVGILPVALPGFAKQVHNNHDLEQSYLQALSYMSVVLFPALVLLVFLAHPAVLILLGDRWISAVPIVQIMSIAGLATLPLPLNMPVLSALGAVKKLALIGLVSVPLYVLVLYLFAPLGLVAIAWSYVVIIPLHSLLSLVLVRQEIPFAWTRLVKSLRASVIVTAATALVPLLAIYGFGLGWELSIVQGIAVGVVSLLAWLVGLRASGHMLYGEVEQGLGMISRKLNFPREQG